MKAMQLLWAIPLLGTLAVPAVADNRHHDGHHGDRIEQRIDRQHRRIKAGIRSGELTRQEAKRLRRQQRHISRLERRFWHDGHLDRHERRTLRRALDVAGDRIYRLKHNDRERHERDDGYRDYRRHDNRYDHTGWAVNLNVWDYL